MSNSKSEKITVENVNHSGKTRQVDAALYAAMKRAILKVLPSKPPGLTLAELSERLHPNLPEKLFPEGAGAGWWAKTVQLDLEAKGVLKRENTKPLRLHKR